MSETTVKKPMTWADLEALLPDAHIEVSCVGEVVIYTGLALDPFVNINPRSVPLVEFCEECESGSDLLPGESCEVCEREAVGGVDEH